MNLAGMLVEYLITGCSALIWIWLLFLLPNVDLPSGMNVQALQPHQLAFFLPPVYVLGLLVDYVAKHLTDFLDALVCERFWYPLAKRMGARLPKKYKLLSRLLERPDRPDVSIDEVEIFSRSPELGKQIELRSSRDRAARGALVNTLLIGLLLTIHSDSTAYGSPTLFMALTLLGGWLWFLVWLRCHRLTDRYKARAKAAIGSA